MCSSTRCYMHFRFYLLVSGQKVKTSFQTPAEKLETERIVIEKKMLNYLAFITSPRSIKMSLILLLLDKTYMYVCSDKNLPTHKFEQSPQRFILNIYKYWLLLKNGQKPGVISIPIIHHHHHTAGVMCPIPYIRSITR